MFGQANNAERYSGHESFICRYGWLPKIHAAISNDSSLLKDDEVSTVHLGIGRNMVRSIQFWGEATGIIESSPHGGHEIGAAGKLLFGDWGWDPYLENIESLWLLHWITCTRANLAAWNCVFGSLALTRFTRKQLQNTLKERRLSFGRTLASSTIDQHAGIFCSTYKQSKNASAHADDTLWSPFQDLNLMRTIDDGAGEEVYVVEPCSPIGLSLRVFATVLSDYWQRNFLDNETIRLSDIVHGQSGPGVILRLNESAVRALLIGIEESGEGGFRLIDTADTQQVAVDWVAHKQWAIRKFPEGAQYV